jgi:hypothetical protein
MRNFLFFLLILFLDKLQAFMTPLFSVGLETIIRVICAPDTYYVSVPGYLTQLVHILKRHQ